ncbi:MAG: GNAT family N-acetyltransferase [Desulfobacula sp.]|nr:GNAT family N-acetyltransferase [Desulfobacula sp.]
MILFSDKIQIIPFADKYAEVFKQLNLEWLTNYELFEPADLKYLDKPRQVIVEQGGKILMAMMEGFVVGTCAIIREDDSTAELAKLAVSQDIQGKGIGRMLTVESIKVARKMGFKKLILVSNKKLTTAVHLYESLGFKHASVPEDTIYETADVYMELIIN